MNTNPILEEVWRVKDELAREAGYDMPACAKTPGSGQKPIRIRGQSCAMRRNSASSSRQRNTNEPRLPP